MKRLLTCLLAAAMILSLTACGEDTAAPSGETGTSPTAEVPQETTLSETPDPEPEPEPEEVLSNDIISIDALCVNDAYRDENESSIRMVYLFYTITAQNENLKADSKYTTITINDTNAYESDHFATAAGAKYMPNYYYSSYIEDVYIGSSLKVVATFYIPEGDLAPGRTITLKDSQIPGVEALHFSTDILQHFDGIEAMAQAIDPEGYAAEMSKRDEADAETTAAVKAQIDGYYWSFYVNSLSYQIEFWSDNTFELRTSLVNNSGTYSVRNGYIFCTYDNGYVVEIPYELTENDIDLDVVAAFDVKAG